jgi:CheY-like chemotaxis protein/anti-sigma regulatory factor (Ser/Thr protein kinase)
LTSFVTKAYDFPHKGMTSTRPSRGRVLIVDDDRALNNVLVDMLKTAGYSVRGALDGAAAVKQLDKQTFDLVLLDLGLPKVAGLDILKMLRDRRPAPKVIVMTADDTPQTVLKVVSEQAYQFLAKPVPPKRVVETIDQAIGSLSESLPIEVVSAKPDWMELIVPCQVEVADRIESFVHGLITHLPEVTRDAVAYAFRELLMNAIEWGGRLDPTRKVRIACIRTRRMLLYRIQDPGSGFRIENLDHAAISNKPDRPYAHMEARNEKGLRPGGFGLLMTRTLVDDLIYNEARNEVVFVKYLDQGDL